MSSELLCEFYTAVKLFPELDYSILAASGYYLLEGQDEEGWPHFKQLKGLPTMDLMEQETFLKDHILLYFENNSF